MKLISRICNAIFLIVVFAFMVDTGSRGELPWFLFFLSVFLVYASWFIYLLVNYEVY